MITFETNEKKNNNYIKQNNVVVARTIDVGTVIYRYTAKEDDELTLEIGDVVEIVSKDKKASGDEGWWLGRFHGTEELGVFPHNYVLCHTCCLHKYTCCR